ncbi:kinase-like domain-containing protein [Chaetomium fimeti]|uniref:Kinase-like domain-containing protein n=1 Tax=Chaetomium fimeti TaxID=1854472 RepID=A0AAE0H848_9PEZI|nr:kinase-like domain-containing protein [Chaetomium fimeti]
MGSKPTLPYCAPENVLPGPIPTVEEILKAEQLRRAGQAVTGVARIREHFIVKFGRHVNLQEGENMLFVRQFTNVPVPTVYALFSDEKKKCNFIKDLTAPQKTAIASQLRENMEELRQTPSQGYYGGIWRQPTRDYTFEDPNSMAPVGGAISAPHESEEQWVDAMWRCLDIRMKSAERERLPVLRKLYQIIFKGHKPVFTHADFFPGNMILRDDNKGVVIIDWERSGWYPSFWEYCHAMTQLDYESDFWEYIPSILDQYVAELGWMRTHRESLLFF